MTPRTRALRDASLQAAPRISSERALLITAFYREHDGKYSPPMMRALAYRDLCERKTIYIGDGELIVGERGPAPKAVPTFPELTCHSVEDLRILNSRPKTSYAVSPDVITDYETMVIPYWRHSTSQVRESSGDCGLRSVAAHNWNPTCTFTGTNRPVTQ